MNLPWGRQVTVDGALATFYRRALAEMRRVLTADGRLVVLTALPDLASPPAARPIERRVISLHGQRPTILVFAAEERVNLARIGAVGAWSSTGRRA